MTAPGWALLTQCSTGFEAELARASLETAEIPVIVHGAQPGIFGAGFQGTLPGGVSLFVPAIALAEARELLGLDDDGGNPGGEAG